MSPATKPQGWRALWYPVRALLLRSRAVNEVVFNLSSARAKRLSLAKLTDVRAQGLRVLRPREFVSAVTRHSDVCHIVGSGWSLNRSIGAIAAEDFVFGFNLAALADLHFDVYLSELHSRDNDARSELSALLELLFKQRLGHRMQRLHFHSFQRGFIDPSFLRESYGDAIPVLADFQLSSRYADISPPMRDVIAERLLKDDPDAFAVVATTAITAISSAFRLGFRHIVVHGLDGGGPHFFAEPGFRLDAPFDQVLKFYPKADANTSYYPGERGLLLLPALRAALAKRGVSLWSASPESPSARYLPLYVGKEPLKGHDAKERVSVGGAVQ